MPLHIHPRLRDYSHRPCASPRARSASSDSTTSPRSASSCMSPTPEVQYRQGASEDAAPALGTATDGLPSTCRGHLRSACSNRVVQRCSTGRGGMTRACSARRRARSSSLARQLAARVPLACRSPAARVSRRLCRPPDPSTCLRVAAVTEGTHGGGGARGARRCQGGQGHGAAAVPRPAQRVGQAGAGRRARACRLCRGRRRRGLSSGSRPCPSGGGVVCAWSPGGGALAGPEGLVRAQLGGDAPSPPKASTRRPPRSRTASHRHVA